MAALDQKFKGQALARLENYAGKMDLIKVAAADATEVIGKGLVDALTILSKDNSIQNLSDDFGNLANNIANVIVNLAKLTDKLGSVVNNPSFKPALILLAFASKNPKAILFALGYAGATGAAEALTKDYGSTSTQQSSTTRVKDYVITTKLLKSRKDEYAIITASNKQRTEIDKLKDKFDVERIGLTAALNAATDEETKLRIKAQLAILDNNEALARKYNAELEAAVAAKKLADSMTQSAAALEAAFRATIARLAIYDPVRNIAVGQTGGFSNVPAGGVATGSNGGSTSVGVKVDVSGATGGGVSSTDIEQTVQEAILSLYRQGRNQVPAGAL